MRHPAIYNSNRPNACGACAADLDMHHRRHRRNELTSATCIVVLGVFGLLCASYAYARARISALLSRSAPSLSGVRLADEYRRPHTSGVVAEVRQPSHSASVISDARLRHRGRAQCYTREATERHVTPLGLYKRSAIPPR